MSAIDDKIRNVLVQYGKIEEMAPMIGVDDDLYQAGLSSHASVNVMLELEDQFEIEFPDSLLRKDTFQSIAAIRGALESLGVAAA